MHLTAGHPDGLPPAAGDLDGRREQWSGCEMSQAEPVDSNEATALGDALILDARSELLFFKTAAHLEAYVEAIDVANGEYGPCWKGHGQPFELSVCSQPSTLLGIVPYRQDAVRVVSATAQPSGLGDLHLALLRYLEAVGLEPEMPVTNDTGDLLAFAVEHAGWS